MLEFRCAACRRLARGTDGFATIAIGRRRTSWERTHIVVVENRTDGTRSPAAGREATDWRFVRRLVVGLGLGWSLAFAVVGLAAGLQMFGDGAFFSYAIAVTEAWAYHWHNISGRVFVYLLSHVPAEAYIRLTGDVRGGIVVYGFLHFASQLAGLAATWKLDRTGDRVFFGFACLSTACLCPLVFGFPTEMWISHALFWPALAVAHDPRRNRSVAVSLTLLTTALVLTHEGAVLFAAAIAMTAFLHGRSDARGTRALGAFAAAVLVWVAIKWSVRPSPYLAEALSRNALNLIDIRNSLSGVFLVLLALLAGFAGLVALARWADIHHSPLVAPVIAGIVLSALAIYWLVFDQWLLGESRYYYRTLLLLATPALGVLASAVAFPAVGRRDTAPALVRRTRSLLDRAGRALTPSDIATALVLVTLVHTVETAKFVAAWADYKSAIADLTSAPSPDKQPFVSAARTQPYPSALTWHSTTQYLSILLAPGYATPQIVVDPDPGYFWLSCETAMQTEAAAKLVPLESRRLIRLFSCKHRHRLP